MKSARSGCGDGAIRVQPGRKPHTPIESSVVEEVSAFRRGEEERRQADRRGQPTRPWNGLLTPLRRSDGRRETDPASYVDRYTRQDVVLLLSIFLLNVADAFFTLMWLGRGGREANPIMDFFLDIGPWAFLAQKCLVVGLWLIILLVHKNFRFARIGLYSMLVVYGILLILHFGILASGVRPPGLATRRDLEAPVVREFWLSRQLLPQTRVLAIDDPRIPDDAPPPEEFRGQAGRSTWE